MPDFYGHIHSMGTRLEWVLPGVENRHGVAITERIGRELELLTAEISNYDEGSVISRINRGAAFAAVEVGDYLLEMIREGMRYHALTAGYYDFTLGGWTSIPDLIRDTGVRFRELTEVPFGERIVLDDHTVRFGHRDVRIDAGGIGKGMAMRLIGRHLQEEGIATALVSFGGSSILGIGSHPYGHAWKVGISHPLKEGVRLATHELKDMALSISGNSKNNRKKYGNQGHILDPFRGTFYSEEGLVVVMAADPLDAEVLSTALLAAGEVNEEKILNSFGDVRVDRYNE